MSSGRKRVLIVDDDTTVTRLLESLISEEADVTVAGSGVRAIEALGKRSYQLIFLDLRMPGGSGQSVIDYLDEAGVEPMPKVIVLSAVANENTHLNKKVVTALIRKPFDPTYIGEVVRRTLIEVDPPTD